VEMIRALRAARRSAMKARTQAANQLQGLRVTAPEELRRRLRGLSTKELVLAAARFRLADGPSDVPTATKFALRSVARRYEALSREIVELEAHLDRLVVQVAPELVSLPGIGTDNATTLLIVALKTTPRGWGARPPSPISVRGRSHRSLLLLRQGGEAPSQPYIGNREANRALYMICLGLG
jgi:transposase